ncbi:serine/threonine protein kinase [Paraliomyxa miuraensis]|uniref:serine/threonine protein kinase n=1 Tax=Paraliomyxa miuraensis TaxID=376150 RepID=UPI00224EDD76|nr:serine/threonine-protein kinase [Paraliomyxa miuraensis]MCX4239105.1 serine/threonine protein kinase [Paraliomyxa miuraensis]
MLLSLPPRIVRDLHKRVRCGALDDVIIVLELFRGPPSDRVLIQRIEINGNALDYVTLECVSHGPRSIPHPGSLMAFLDLVGQRVHELPDGDPLRCPACEDIASITLQIGGAEETFSVLASEDARLRHEQMLSPGAMQLVALMERLVKETLRGAESAGAFAGRWVEDSCEDPPSRIGRFRMEAVLARWHHGTILRVHDPDRHESVAMKLGDRTEPLRTRLMLEHEYQVLAAIDHPNIVTVHEVGVDNRRPFMTMELVLGSPVDEWARMHGASRAERIAALLQAGHGLAATHAAGFVHGNFGPSNALISADGRVRLIDFHWAHRGDGPPITAWFGAGFMPAYAAPEVLAGRRGAAHSDQFSLCVAVYEVLYGVRPFPGKTPTEVTYNVMMGNMRPLPSESVPHHVRDAVLRGLCSAAAERWPSVDALLDELGDAAEYAD